MTDHGTLLPRLDGSSLVQPDRSDPALDRRSPASRTSGTAQKLRSIAVDVNGERRTYLAACPHMGGPLDRGTVEGDALVCPWHRFRYDARTGAGRERARLLGLCLRSAPDGAEVAASLCIDEA